jgi:Mandelate racemase / muconate lactonizing enzyme, N-terminal domain
MTGDAFIVSADARLVRLPVDPPRGDAIQKFDALEMPIVDIADRSGHRGLGFSYTIGTGGTAILSLLHDELLHQLIGDDSRHIVRIMEHLRKSIHALTPGCVASTALVVIDVALWDLAGHRANALGKADGTAHGGHLLEGHVRPTLEIVITETPRHRFRRLDPGSGLALIDPTPAPKNPSA